MILQVDEHEPADIIRLLEPALDLDVGPRNSNGEPDYGYTGSECYCHQVSEYFIERKTFSDLIGGIEEVEEQLQGYLLKWQGSKHLRLIIEGVIEPAFKGVYVYTKDNGRNNFKAGLRGDRQQEFKKIYSWLQQVGKYWEIVWTPSHSATAGAITAYYWGDQEDEESHLTFKRMFKHLDYRVNPQAQRIMGAAGNVPFGPVRAESVAKHFGTPIRAFKATVDEWTAIPGIGRKTAVDYLRGLGRGDV